MNIGFYIHYTTISAGGIFTYTIGILKEILKSSAIEKVVIITSNEVNEKLASILPNSKVKIVNINRSSTSVRIRLTLYFLLFTTSLFIKKIVPKKKLSRVIIKFSNLLNPYTEVIKAESICLFHVPVQYSPVYCTSIPVIITMHDLQELHFPENFSLKERFHRKIINGLAVQYSEHIIVSFDHVKNDIIKFFNV